MQHSVDNVINGLGESKIYEIQNCLRLPNILGTVTCIKARRVITPLQFYEQFHVYIERHRKLYFPFLFLVTNSFFTLN